MPVTKVSRIVPRIAESYRKFVADLGNTALHDVGRARAELRRLLGGQIRLVPSEDRTFLEAEEPEIGDRLIQLAAANGLNFKEK